MKTEGSYRIVSVRSFVRSSVRSFVPVRFRKPLQQFFRNLARSRGHLRLKNYPSGFLRFYVFFLILAKKWPKNEVFDTFLKNGANDFSKNLTYSVELCILAMFRKLAPKNVFRQFARYEIVSYKNYVSSKHFNIYMQNLIMSKNNKSNKSNI